MFSWKPIYMELAKKLLEYRDQRHELIEILTDATKKGLKVIKLEDENPKGNKIPLSDIDPFTFFSSFNREIKKEEKQNILLFLKERFSLTSTMPNDFSGIPTVNNQQARFFAYSYERDGDDIDVLWSMAEDAIKLNPDKIDTIVFAKCLKVKCSGVAKITMGLFWFCPDTYLALDKKNRSFLKNSYGVDPNVSDWNSYLELLEKVKSMISSDYADISHEAHLIATGEKPKGSRPFLKTPNGESASSNHHPPKNPVNDEHPLNTILYGPPGTGKTYTSLKRAVEIIDGKQSPDKDFTAIKKRFDELYDNKQIKFITFHQSYSYEDFVEGIRPVIEKTDTANSPRYICRDGAFKQICAAAAANYESAVSVNSADVNLDKVQIWKMSLGNSLIPKENHIYKDCISGGFIAHGAGRDLDFGKCETKDDIKNMLTGLDWNNWPSTLSHNISQIYALKCKMQIGDIVIISDGNNKFRAIGKVSGNYFYDANFVYMQKRPVVWLKKFNESQPVERILKNKAFTQLTLYLLSRNNLKLDALKELLSTDKPDNKKNYVLIIDEINRGNISKILGELITLLEPDKRLGAKHELKVTLPYSQQTFGVPNNLYILGTMNTADKSIALVDVALRRRFVFEELMPDFSVCTHLTEEMRYVLEQLNKRITLRKDRDHQIGHSYFMDVHDNGSFNNVFEKNIMPLLQEYFWNDWEGLKFVLGEENSSNGPFIYKIPDCENGNRYARNKWQWFSDAKKEPFDYLVKLHQNITTKTKNDNVQK